jgi:deoxyribodipyrimidine photo-lyase
MSTQDLTFPTDYSSILKRLEDFDPTKYQQTRNYLSGGVSHLSPYIVHGVLGLPQVMKAVVSKVGIRKAEHFIFQLGWREYFQKIWIEYGDLIFKDLKSEQSAVVSLDLPAAVLNANTGVEVLDEAISELYETGYMHNHARMWIASVVCNTAQTAWKNPADWLYYHLLDGDLASNTLSWQWVAGTFSSKKYLANQDNLNKYSKSSQSGTFLDFSYEFLAERTEVQTQLVERAKSDLSFEKPKFDFASLDELDVSKSELVLHHAWNLDPTFAAESEHSDSQERLLLLEPSHFERFRISPKRMDFILALAQNISNLKIVWADFEELSKILSNFKSIKFKSHPAANWNVPAEKISGFLFEGVNPPFRSYFDFWNKAKKQLKNWE